MANFIYYCGQNTAEQDGQNAKIMANGRRYNINTDNIDNSNNQKQDKYGNNQLVESRNYLERLYGY